MAHKSNKKGTGKSAPKRSANDLVYIQSKVRHMNRMGIPASVGKHGGACPEWLREQQNAEKAAA